MSITRRSLLLLIPVCTAWTAWAPPAVARSVVNVRDHGAVGNGKSDDSPAVQAAVAALQSGDTLFFPAGSYRFARQYPEGSAAVAIAGISDVSIEFDPGAELVMDNLDSATGMGTSHGIFIRGPASRIALRNVKIRWAAPAPRSFGDGIRILGYPTGTTTAPVGWSGPPAPVSGVSIASCDIRTSPQAGVILIGVSDVTVDDLQVHDTAADGLHFNACRRARVRGHTVTDNGDDGLALVTYYADRPTFDRDAQSFAFPDLTKWSNADFEISDVSVSGGRANGVRLAGANGVRLSGLTVSGKVAGAGVIVDSAAEIGPETSWQYVASRGVHLDDIAVDHCEMGIQLLARPGSTGDAKFSDFGVAARDVRIRDCSNWAVRAESLTRQPISGLRVAGCDVDAMSTTGGNGGIGLGNTRNLTFDDISVSHSEPVIAFNANNSQDLAVGVLNLSITDAAGDTPASIPCALFENVGGSIDTMAIDWPRAPASWTPVRIKRHSQARAFRSDKPSVAIQKFSVTPVSVVNGVDAS